MTSRRSRCSLSLAIFSLLVLLVLGGGTAIAQDYVGYAVIKDGELPLPESLDRVRDDQLIDVRWGEFSGPQSRVAVLEVDNNSGMSSFRMSGPGGQVVSYDGFDYGSQVPVNGIESMITDSMFRTGRFRMVERESLGDVLYEQDLASSGRVAKPSGAKTGNVAGAQFLVKAVITSYEPDFKKRKGGLGGITRGLLGGAKLGKSKSMIGMNFRLIDAETSDIVFTKQVDVVMSKTEFDLGGIGWGGSGALGGFISSYSKTPIGQAVMAAVNVGVFELIKQIGSTPMTGSVVKIDGETIYLNVGSDVCEPGDKFEAIAKGEELIDPDTGLSLGGEEESLGFIEIIDAKEKFSLARPVDVDLTRLQRGDRVVSTAEAAPLKFAAEWSGKKKK